MAASLLPLLLLPFFSILLHFNAISAVDLRQTFRIDIHHRFSDTVRRWARSRGVDGDWPEKGTEGYYSALASSDRLRLDAFGAASDLLTFADGNSTYKFPALGSLYYAAVALGTPNSTFLVALDTGSYLLWVPCDCKSCAPTSLQGNGYVLDLPTYSPSLSSTSRNVPCNSSYCNLQIDCPSFSSCPYSVAYQTLNTSTTGLLVQDIMYLTTEGTHGELIEANIVFGCGSVQTGSLLSGGAPDGLMGLGMANISVPSILASLGLVPNSFSMCFGLDGTGRINFGDKGSSNQGETQFNVDQLQPVYNISITGIEVGNVSVGSNFTSIFDTGTSFTTLADPAYTILSEKFAEQVKQGRHTPDSEIPFEYCYQISSNETMIQLPGINFTTRGGSAYPVYNPIIVLYDQQTPYMYCLAVVRSSSANIIGQNFMSGLRVVFDRERLVLGWKTFDCSDEESTLPVPAIPRSSPATSPTSPAGVDAAGPTTPGNPGSPTAMVDIIMVSVIIMAVLILFIS